IVLPKAINLGAIRSRTKFPQQRLVVHSPFASRKRLGCHDHEQRLELSPYATPPGFPLLSFSGSEAKNASISALCSSSHRAIEASGIFEMQPRRSTPRRRVSIVRGGREVALSCAAKKQSCIV